MSRVYVPVTQLDPSYTTSDPTGVVGDPVNGHYCENDGYIWLDVRNTGAAPSTITIHVLPSAQTMYNVADTVQTLQPGDHYLFGAFPVNLFTLPPIVLGTTYQGTGSTPVAPTPGTANCMTFDVDSTNLVLRAFRL